MSNETIVFHGGVQVASFEGRDWVPKADYATLGEALTRMNEKAAKLERELTRYRDPAMALVPREPTWEMIAAMDEAATRRDIYSSWADVHRAMIAAGEGK